MAMILRKQIVRQTVSDVMEYLNNGGITEPNRDIEISLTKIIDGNLGLICDSIEEDVIECDVLNEEE